MESARRRSRKWRRKRWDSSIDFVPVIELNREPRQRLRINIALFLHPAREFSWKQIDFFYIRNFVLFSWKLTSDPINFIWNAGHFWNITYFNFDHFLISTVNFIHFYSNTFEFFCRLLFIVVFILEQISHIQENFFPIELEKSSLLWPIH